ncbi:DUF2802 domain-containing protein [Cellvibrio japonicus]|uniref:DUF2802 domain-containing protein n=1 Tax=Cellvibrio japonicus TaxID=155077 RepID=UPI0011D1121D|nr:DUF2802 domain-containing protein [Cellvibrio japonicus]QEI12588.1 DUF2802 domain-containing protein [Cellvibrio japonicus]QEI16162.1 DUF2802 domain-containing protein [Cellvibrio japonicus]QEI19740.1 DUF2802 domain-containing protein [Cellvibrio japonicus]
MTIQAWGLLEWSLLGCLALSLLALLLALYCVKQVRHQAHETERLLQRLTREVAASSSGSVGMGQRLLAMEKRLQVTEAQPKTEKPDYYQDEEFQPYAQAAQLFKLGLDADEVARRCGLSRAEASLLEVMQKSGS